MEEEISKHALREQKKEEREKQQNKEKDINASKQRKSTIKKSILTVLGIAIVAYGIYIFLQLPGPHDDLAQCLTENGAIFYGSFECSACNQQKQLFGKSMEFVNYVECGPLSQTPLKVCTDAGVKLYPTWFVNDEKLEGLQSLNVLAEKTGCEA